MQDRRSSKKMSISFAPIHLLLRSRDCSRCPVIRNKRLLRCKHCFAIRIPSLGISVGLTARMALSESPLQQQKKSLLSEDHLWRASHEKNIDRIFYNMS